MIKKIKELTNNTLSINLSYLIVIEILMKILPLVTVPYIVRTIGVEKFGLITFVYVFISYFQLLTNYGFNALGTKDISGERKNIEEYSRIFWSIILSKTILGIVSLILLFILVSFIPKLYTEWIVYIFSLGLLFNQILFPIWFFQGMEEMKYIAIFTFISRFFYTISIFIFINDKSDYILVPLINSISLVFIGILSLVFLVKKFNIIFVLPTKNILIHYFKEGWHLFLSYITNSLYTQSNIFLLGTISDYKAVGVYSLAMTIIGAFIKVVSQFNKVIYPHLAKFSKNITKLQLEARKYLKIYVIVLIFISLLILLNADIIIGLLFGSQHFESVIVLRILSITILLSSLGGFYTRYMIIMLEQKMILNITFKTMISNFILVIPGIFLFQATGLAISVVLVEMYQVYLNYSYNKELKVKIRN